MNEPLRGEPRAARAWLERVPPERHLAWAASSLGAVVVLFAILATRDAHYVGLFECALAVVAIALVFLFPLRLGPTLAVATTAAFALLELASGRFEQLLAVEPIAGAFALLAALLAASFVRLGIRRRDTELEIAAETIAELTHRDPISELLAGGREPTWLEAELARARRHHHQLTLVLVRPDRRSAFEERGHDVSLRVLEAVAEVIGSELRATDIALRRDIWTFSVILPETPVEGARVAAERIRLNLQARIGASDDAPVTVSAGVTTFPNDASTNDELVRAAERALEHAEQLGGNRTICVSMNGNVPRAWTLSAARAEAS